MKINVCDVCLAEGRLTHASGKKWLGGAMRPISRKIDVCNEHTNWGEEYWGNPVAWDAALLDLEGKGLKCLPKL